MSRHQREQHFCINVFFIFLDETLKGIFTFNTTVIIADLADYGEWKTGKRCDSIIFIVQTFLYKISIAIAKLILGIGITVMSFNFYIVYKKKYWLYGEKYDRIKEEIELNR